LQNLGIRSLETGNPTVKFKPRPVEGVRIFDGTLPEKLILDGQQRLTALYQSLFSQQAASTYDVRGKEIKRWYYIDMNKALSANGDREEAILSVPEDRVVHNFQGNITADYSSIEKECANEVFPINLVFDTVVLTNWQLKYIQSDPQQVNVRLQKWNDLVQKVIQRFQQYQIPLIVLRKQTPKVAVCQVFEKVNTGGVSLTVFELLTATFAADDFELRVDWAKRERRLRKFKVLQSLQSDDFLQVVTLLATFDRKQTKPEAAVSCKRKDILDLTLEEYSRWSEAATTGFERAAKILHLQKLFDGRDLPYRTQLVPLAAVMAVLGDQADGDAIRSKLARWYWCGVFGELYGSAIETRFAKDLIEMVAWIRGGAEPSTIQDANFTPNRLFTLRTRNSAA